VSQWNLTKFNKLDFKQSRFDPSDLSEPLKQAILINAERHKPGVEVVVNIFEQALWIHSKAIH